MIGESLSPTPRQRAEEILRRLARVEREALLVKCWMSHDARWFMAAARECGMEVTSSPRWGPRIFLLLVLWSGRPRPGEPDMA